MSSHISYFSQCFETPKSFQQIEDELLSHQKRLSLISTLPRETTWPGMPLRHYQGFWFPEAALPGVMSLHDHFSAAPSDIILVTYPKSGTTWLKAIATAISNRTTSPNLVNDHHPQELSPYLEGLFARGPIPDLSLLPSPRILGTHIPFSSLSSSVKTSNCKIVYLCRDPKDILVSFWYFTEGMRREGTPPLSFSEAFETFAAGRMAYGPMWEHMMDYWQESTRDTKRVMFMRYEEMTEEPKECVRRLAGFMGRPFSDAEESEGKVEEIVRLCSFETLSGLEVNKVGVLRTEIGWNIKRSSFFRKGKVGDWVEHMSKDMAERLDSITEEKLEGSGLRFRQVKMARE